jgi:hypothetical protein
MGRVVSFDYRLAIIVPAASLSAADAAARQINPSGPNYDGNAFTVPLSRTGSGSPTHFAMYTAATQEMIAAMADALPSIPGVMYWRHGIGGDLQASNVTSPIGQSWSWEHSMETVELRVVE